MRFSFLKKLDKNHDKNLVTSFLHEIKALKGENTLSFYKQHFS